MKTTFLGVELIDGLTICKVAVFAADGSFEDAAWGQAWEIAEWLKTKGYPAAR